VLTILLIIIALAYDLVRDMCSDDIFFGAF